METRLLIRRVKNGGLRTLLGGERRGEIEFEALGEEVVKFDLVAEDVGGCPGLGQSQAVDFVSPLALNVTSNGLGLVVADTGDLECHVGRGLGLDLKGSAVEVVVLS